MTLMDDADPRARSQSPPGEPRCALAHWSESSAIARHRLTQVNGASPRGRRARRRRIFELAVTRGPIDRPELFVAVQRRQMQRRQDEHRISLFDAHAREQFQRERVVFEQGEQGRVERQTLVIFGRQCKVIALSRVVEVKVRACRSFNLRFLSRSSAEVELHATGAGPARGAARQGVASS